MVTWSTPIRVKVGDMITTSHMRSQVHDNLIFLGDQHAHGSSTGEGAGSRNLGPLVKLALGSESSTEASPGRLWRKATSLLWSSDAIDMNASDGTSTEATRRTLGGSSNQVARGNHPH